MVTDKKNFVLRIDRETYQSLERWAADEFRSVNGQIEYILNQAVREKKKLVEKQPQTHPTDASAGESH